MFFIKFNLLILNILFTILSPIIFILVKIIKPFVTIRFIPFITQNKKLAFYNHKLHALESSSYFDDMPISKTQIGLIKNTLAQKILIIKKNDDEQDHQSFLELGFTHDIEIKPARVYSYNLKTYNNKRGWNNPEGWANPENFEKYRW